ncbi:MAG: phage portal protein [Bacteroidales bacterium]|nr:phage portal protein [Bacteroidales bacterium]
MDTYLTHLRTFFRNLTLNAVGADRDLYRLIQDGDIDRAIDMMQDRDEEVDKAVAEYNTQTHAIQRRPNKRRKGSPDFMTNKIPRNLQWYINEVEMFFLLGSPIEWDKTEGDDDAFALFKDFLADQHFDARMRMAKRLAGAETEAAKLYRVYSEDGEIRCDTVVLARSNGYKLRPLFDQYGRMTAFACGYCLKEGGKSVQHWDVYTKEMVFYCKRAWPGWSVTPYSNPLGKIPVVYYRQKKAWDGAVPRIDRMEMLDSKLADTNDYFADPIAKATADVIQSLASPEDTGKLIQVGNNGQFEYINPPQSSATRESEKADLRDSILFDTLTPDLSFEKMRGLGSLSGVAIKNAMVLGYIKRANRIDVYGEMVGRELSVMIEVLCLMHPAMADKLRDMKVTFEFGEPFAADDREAMSIIGQLYQQGVVSLEEAVHQLSLCDHPDDEIRRLKEAREQALAAQQPQQSPREAAEGQQA